MGVTQLECHMHTSHMHTHTSLTTPKVKASYSVLLANLTYTMTSPGTVKLMDLGEITNVGGVSELIFTTIAILGNVLYSWRQGKQKIGVSLIPTSITQMDLRINRSKRIFTA